MNAQPSHSVVASRLDLLILELLASHGSLSAQELTRHLQHKREKSVSTALDVLRLKGQVQRVGLTNRFRLSPTQAERINKFSNCSRVIRF